MLEEMIAVIKDKQAKRPISQESFDRWRKSQVTQRFFEDLELSVIDSFQDYLTDMEPDRILPMLARREGASMLVEQLLDWSPAGVEGVNNED